MGLKTVDGYEVFSDGEDSVKLHRLLSCLKMSPYKVFSGTVHTHHINTIPWDNRPRNVVPLYAGKHQTIHDRFNWCDMFYPERNKFYRNAILKYYLSSLDVEDAEYVDDDTIKSILGTLECPVTPRAKGTDALSDPPPVKQTRKAIYRAYDRGDIKVDDDEVIVFSNSDDVGQSVFEKGNEITLEFIHRESSDRKEYREGWANYLLNELDFEEERIAEAFGVTERTVSKYIS